MASARKVEIVFPPGTEHYAHCQTGARGAVELAKKYGKCEDVHRAVNCLEQEDMPFVALEIGCGIGRASVYLFKVLGWDETKFYLLDGDVDNRDALKMAKRTSGTYKRTGQRFYNSLPATREFCKANGIKDSVLLNAAQWGPGKMQPKTRVCDVAYSFKAVGFHFPIGEYLEWLHDILCCGALVIFEVRNGNSGRWDFTEDQIMTADGFAAAGGYEIVKVPSKREKFPLLVLRRI